MATQTLRTLGRWILYLLAAVGTAATVVGMGFVTAGISARPGPSRLETWMARTVRHLLIPASARTRANPVAASPEVVKSGRAHFADHCATCHGNDGKGDTMYGRALYPRAPDLTLPATQELADGELFWIIENGVRLTGMPAFGNDDPSDDEPSWELVRFIRTLPDISLGEIAEMERLNPTLSRAEVEEERKVEDFLAGGEPPGEAHEDHD